MNQLFGNPWNSSRRSHRLSWRSFRNVHLCARLPNAHNLPNPTERPRSGQRGEAADQHLGPGAASPSRSCPAPRSSSRAGPPRRGAETAVPTLGRGPQGWEAERALPGGQVAGPWPRSASDSAWNRRPEPERQNGAPERLPGRHPGQSPNPPGPPGVATEGLWEDCANTQTFFSSAAQRRWESSRAGRLLGQRTSFGNGAETPRRPQRAPGHSACPRDRDARNQHPAFRAPTPRVRAAGQGGSGTYQCG